MAVCVGRVAGRGLDISLRISVLLFGAMGSFGKVVHTGKRGVIIFLKTVFVFNFGTGAWGHISSWSAEVPRGEIPGTGGV